MIKLRVKKLNGFEKSWGLMFQKEIFPVYFETRFGIHTFFLQKPIDVIILDSGGIVQDIKQNLKPWRVFFWNPKWKRIVELPSGALKKMEIDVGARISLQEVFS